MKPRTVLERIRYVKRCPNPAKLTVTGCLKIEAVCLIGGTKLASLLRLRVKSYRFPAPLAFDLPPFDLPFVVANAGFNLPVW